MLYYLLFLFVAFGAKLVLALVTIFLLLPSDAQCSECDGETLLVRMGPVGRTVSFLLFGQLQQRWCPRCGSEVLARPLKRGEEALPAQAPSGTPIR